MKILVVGGTRGVGKEVCEHFGPAALGIGRTNGYDVGLAGDRRRIVELSRDFDLVWNHAHNGHIEGQTRLLMDLFQDWSERGKAGHIFSTGSYATYMALREYRRYAVIKFLHDQVCRSLAEKITHARLPFALTNLRLGKLRKEPNEPALGAAEIAPWLQHLYENRGLSVMPELVLTMPPPRALPHPNPRSP